jgi:hypothetical protein
LAYLYYSHRIFRPKLLICAYIGISAAFLFSSVSLDIRLHGGREGTSRAMVSLYMEKLFTAESLIALLNPFFDHPSTKNIRDYQAEHFGDDFFDIKYFNTSASLGQRFVVLPMMDIVCGNYPETDLVRWESLFNIVTASFPYFGQRKDLNYGDELTWELGLRAYDNVGFPMITNACELFTIGGWTGLALITIVQFFLIFIFVDILRRQLGFPILYILVASQMIIWVTISTTAITVSSTAIRGLPTTIFLIWLAGRIANRLTRPAIQPLRRKRSIAVRS